MQINTSITSAIQPDLSKAEIVLPSGLIGLKEYKHFQLVADQNSYPFVVMRNLGDDPVEFVTVVPTGLVPDYRIEISDADAAELEIASPEENPLVLNIAIVYSLEPQKVTINLIAPVIINRATGIGKQVVIENYSWYSSDYPLIAAED